MVSQILTLRARLLALLLAIVALVPSAHALDRLTATVDRNPAMVGETITLRIVAHGATTTSQPDTSALMRNFVVGRTQTGTSTSIVNGDVSHTTTWSIGLVVRDPGTYQIPAFTVDGQSSQPITLEVVCHSTTDKDNQDVMLRSDLSNTTAYVGQQLIYTSTLLLAVDLQRGNLQPPSLAGATIEQLGEDQDGTEIINGRRYRSISRSYQITPNQAGTLELKGAIFSGDVQLGRGGFFNRGRSKPVGLVDESQTVEIKAIPDNFPGQWLVSDLVVLQEEWPENAEFRVGEPITRTLMLTATNVNKEQLPEFPQHYPPQIQLYPDKLQSNQVFRDSRNIAQNSQSVALIPSEAGQLILPELRLPWWNSKTHQLDWARIPAKTINVLPAQPGSASAPAPVATPTPAAPAAATPLTVQTIEGASPLWQWSTLAFALLWLATLLLWWRQRGTAPVAVPQAEKPVDVDHWAQLQQACQDDKPGDIIRLLPLWLADGRRTSLADLDSQAPAIVLVYRQLQQASYSKEAQSTATLSKELLQHLKQFKKTAADADRVANTALSAINNKLRGRLFAPLLSLIRIILLKACIIHDLDVKDRFSQPVIKK